MDKSEEKKVTYYTEEVIAQILKYGRNLAEIQAGGTVKDTVLTVPSYFNQEQRRLFMDAAEMAGLHIIQLVHENVAAATMFGIDRMDTEKSLTVLLYNMGGKDTEVTVARFSATADEKNKTFEYIEIMGEAWDENLGGADFDKVIVDMLAEAFNALPERKGKPDIRKNEKAMKRLFS
jgi:molecular chaperone DnaK (HSP70)